MNIGNAHIQWQSEYEAAQSSQVPRSEGMDEMTQQFGAVNIQSPEQSEEPNCTFAIGLASHLFFIHISTMSFYMVSHGRSLTYFDD
jgi:hypothetical protein